MCPTFLKKCDKLDKRTPENSLPFFPSTEAWTWASTPPPVQPAFPPAVPPPILTRGRNQQERTQQQKETAPSGRPYERRSWNRSKSRNRPTTPDKLPPPLPSFLAIPELTITDENQQQPASTQDDIYA